MPKTAHIFPFFKLPLELRRIIYSYAIGEPEPFFVREVNSCRWVGFSVRDLSSRRWEPALIPREHAVFWDRGGILRVNKAIKHEAEPFLHSPRLIFDAWSDVKPYIHFVGRSNFGFVTHVEFHGYCLAGGEIASTILSMVKCGTMLKDIRFCTPIPDSLDDEADMDFWFHVLDSIEILKGLAEDLLVPQPESWEQLLSYPNAAQVSYLERAELRFQQRIQNQSNANREDRWVQDAGIGHTELVLSKKDAAQDDPKIRWSWDFTLHPLVLRRPDGEEFTPDKVEEVHLHTIDRFLDSRWVKNGRVSSLQYRVAWKDHEKDLEWYPQSLFTEFALEALKEYHEAYPARAGSLWDRWPRARVSPDTWRPRSSRHIDKLL